MEILLPAGIFSNFQLLAAEEELVLDGDIGCFLHGRDSSELDI